MSKIRIYLEEDFSKKIKMPKETRNYLVKVMRLGEGDQIRIFNQKAGEWLASLEGNYLVPQEEIRPPETKEIKSILVFAPTKGQVELVLEKAVELGSDIIIPIITDRSVIRKINLERGNKIILEASEQTGRLIPPKLLDITPLNNLMTTLDSLIDKKKLVFCDPAATKTWQEIQLEEGEALVLVIGPEGGFTEKDLETIPNKDLITLGSNILRAETASLVALTLAKIIIQEL
jgi:16S rRNA (uracil1498-N3)-methyltransferase